MQKAAFYRTGLNSSSHFQDVLAAQNSKGDTALNVAVRRDYYEVTRHILSRGKLSVVSFFEFSFAVVFLAHLSRRLVGELIIYSWSGVRQASSVIHNFKHENLCNQWADHNEILSQASLGWRKGCIRFWARSDQNWFPWQQIAPIGL